VEAALCGVARGATHMEKFTGFIGFAILLVLGGYMIALPLLSFGFFG
jgi:hypothetical protein